MKFQSIIKLNLWAAALAVLLQSHAFADNPLNGKEVTIVNDIILDDVSPTNDPAAFFVDGKKVSRSLAEGKAHCHIKGGRYIDSIISGGDDSKRIVLVYDDVHFMLKAEEKQYLIIMCKDRTGNYTTDPAAIENAFHSSQSDAVLKFRDRTRPSPGKGERIRYEQIITEQDQSEGA